ncbi:MAG: YGL010W-like membrane protein [Flavobacteriales bacterium]|jgi:uncharacterized membrane protein YGL010W
MSNTERLFRLYGESHQNKTNKLIHWIFVPLIFVSVIGLLWSVKLGDSTIFGIPMNVAMVISPLVMIYYFRMNFRIAIGMLLLTFLSFFFAEVVEIFVAGRLWMVMLALFIVSWVFQFIGHGIEGKKPSFSQDLQFFLVGPAWILGALYRALGIKY